LKKRDYTETDLAAGDKAGIALLAEIFEAIGFDIFDEESYNLLAEHAEKAGARSCIYRGDATLHGRCWKLGEGLEVWSVLYESGKELYYADCRPAFRSRYVHRVRPWEMAEYCEDGEAIVRGAIFSGAEILFELQNLTEIKPHLLRAVELPVGLAGLAFSVQVDPGSSRTPDSGRRTPTVGSFTPASVVAEYAEDACENDYLIRGRVLAWRALRNPVTLTPLVWIYLDAKDIRVELLANARSVQGRLRVGATISASIWLQGHFLEEAELSARFEGVDPDSFKGDFWSLLRRSN
jgi:hypothetical protein